MYDYVEARLVPCGDDSFVSQLILKAKDYVEIGIDAEDYFRIKNSGKESK